MISSLLILHSGGLYLAERPNLWGRSPCQSSLAPPTTFVLSTWTFSSTPPTTPSLADQLSPSSWPCPIMSTWCWRYRWSKAFSPCVPTSPPPTNAKEKDSPSPKRWTSQPEWRLASLILRRSIHIKAMTRLVSYRLCDQDGVDTPNSWHTEHLRHFYPWNVLLKICTFFMYFNNNYICDVFSICFPYFFSSYLFLHTKHL